MASHRTSRGSHSRRVLVLGGAGMLGHTLYRECNGCFEATATIRGNRLEGPVAEVLNPDRTVPGVRAEDAESIGRALDSSRANVVVNCIGVVKQLAADSGAAAMVQANALFPHQLAGACRDRGVRLIQISTDCVFSGRKGAYRESDLPDPVDLYGRSKLAGEPEGEGVLTLRTSLIGRELGGAHGLLEWFLSQKDEVRGFTRAIFSGPTAPVLARAICDLIEAEEQLEGTWHVSAEPISKHDLLLLIRDAFGHRIEVIADESVEIDRSLDSSRLREATGWRAPNWAEMVAELSDFAAPLQERNAFA